MQDGANGGGGGSGGGGGGGGGDYYGGGNGGGPPAWGYNPHWHQQSPQQPAQVMELLQVYFRK